MAKVPNFANAVVEPGKLSEYLLNERHIRGRAKARFFAAFGFSRAAPEVLEVSLLAQGEGEIAATLLTPFGVLYVVEGPIQTPTGRTPDVRTVWEIRQGQSAPRL